MACKKYKKAVMVEEKSPMMDLALQAPGCAQIFNLKFYMNSQSLWIVGEVEMPLVDRIISRTNIRPYQLLKDFAFHQI